MNVILLRKEESDSRLPPTDPRVIHLKSILNISDGQIINLGIVGERMGRARIHLFPDQSLKFEFLEFLTPPPILPLTLIIGIPRPPTARRLLRDLASLGVQRIVWTASALNEKSYLASKLWLDGEWEWELMLGAMQGKTCHLPEVIRNEKFYRLPHILPQTSNRFILDGAGGPFPLEPHHEMVLAIGPERGWAPEETAALESWGFVRTSLGPHTLRTETAAIGAAVLYARTIFNFNL